MSSPSPQPGAPVESITASSGSQDDPGARLTWRVALIGAISALLGALIGVGGSLGGTVLTLNHQAAQEVTDLRRQAYLEYLGAANGVVNQIENETSFRIEGEEVPPPTVLSDARRRLALEGTLEEPLAQVQIYGSKDAIDAASDLKADAEAVVRQSILYSVQGRTVKDYGLLQEYLTVADDARNEFAEVIRGELQN